MQLQTILFIFLINLVLGLLLFLIFKRNTFLLIFYVIAWAFILYKFPAIWSVLYFGVPHFTLVFVVYLMANNKDYSKQESAFNMIIQTTKGQRLLPNIDRGTQIFGSSGAGKTASVIAPFLRHYHKWNFSGVLYDYKNGELTELLLGIYEPKRVKIIAPHNPYISDRCNFIDPKIITDEIKLLQIVRVIIMNLSGDNKSESFFSENAEALLCGTILYFKLYHPALCTFPHVCAFLTNNNFQGYRKTSYIDEHTGQEKEKLEFSAFKQLEDILCSDPRIKMQSSAFIKGLSSERQTAAVMSTLLNSLRKFANPSFFWVFSKSDFDLNINHASNRLVISVWNDPSIKDIVSPFVSGTMQAILGEMSVRGQQPSFLAIDEAATLKLLNMASIPATMRSFGIATLYATQDISQGYAQYGVHEFKSILTNLSIQFFGNANDPDTAKYYEKFIDEYEKDRISENKDAGFLGGTTKSINVAKQDTKKIKYMEFFTLKRGEFVKIVDGIAEKIQFPMPNNNRVSIPKKVYVTDSEIQLNYRKTIKDVLNLTIN